MVEQFDLVKHIIKRHLNGKNIGKQGYDLGKTSIEKKRFLSGIARIT